MDNWDNIEEYISGILKSLETINPKLVMVFGSYTNKSWTEDSDLDLIIVLDRMDVPKSYDEKMQLKLEVRKAIREINREIPIDILVYTIPEYNEFINCGSSFSKELIETGRVLYEKAG